MQDMPLTHYYKYYLDCLIQSGKGAGDYTESFTCAAYGFSSNSLAMFTLDINENNRKRLLEAVKTKGEFKFIVIGGINAKFDMADPNGHIQEGLKFCNPG